METYEREHQREKNKELWVWEVAEVARWPLDLLPPGPFRAAQWSTPVSFQYRRYYYLHRSVGERGRGGERPEVSAKQSKPAPCHPLHPIIQRQVSSTPTSCSLIIWDNFKHISGGRGEEELGRPKDLSVLVIYFIWADGVRLGSIFSQIFAPVLMLYKSEKKNKKNNYFLTPQHPLKIKDSVLYTHLSTNSVSWIGKQFNK